MMCKIFVANIRIAYIEYIYITWLYRKKLILQTRQNLHGKVFPENGQISREREREISPEVNQRDLNEAKLRERNGERTQLIKIITVYRKRAQCAKLRWHLTNISSLVLRENTDGVAIRICAYNFAQITGEFRSVRECAGWRGGGGRGQRSLFAASSA